MSFHRTIDLDRWKGFERADQIIMVANEVYRGRLALEKADYISARLSYLRAMDLFDLTTAALGPEGPRRLREHLRWRECLAAEWIKERPDLEANRLLLKTLLLFTPRSARQIPYLT